MAAADDLATVYANLLTALKTATASPKPSYSIGSESYSWSEYLDMLNRQIKVARDNLINEQGPYMITSRGAV